MLKKSLLFACLLLLSIPSFSQQVKALVGGTLIDGFGGTPIRNSVIIVEGERIKAIGQVGSLAIPAGAEVISTEGMSVLPGLWDMHVHLMLNGHSDYTHWDSTYIDVFESALQEVAQEWLDEATLQRRLDTDGPLLPEYRRVELVDQLHSEVWGQGFAAPTFCEELEVVSQRLVAEKHLSLRLRHQGDVVDAIWFGRVQPLAARVTLAYRVETDAGQGQNRVRFVIEAAQE